MPTAMSRLQRLHRGRDDGDKLAMLAAPCLSPISVLAPSPLVGTGVDMEDECTAGETKINRSLSYLSYK